MGVASESVHFTVSSVNGFYGNIYVVFTADGAMDIVPDDDHLNHAISPGHNYEFDRQFIRHATDPLPIHITYSASDVPFTVTHDVQITANLPTG